MGHLKTTYPCSSFAKTTNPSSLIHPAILALGEMKKPQYQQSAAVADFYHQRPPPAEANVRRFDLSHDHAIPAVRELRDMGYSSSVLIPIGKVKQQVTGLAHTQFFQLHGQLRADSSELL